jgi:3-oxoacyl-[acyl-carrier-protein] synthase III
MRFSKVSIGSVSTVEAPQWVSSEQIEARLGPLFQRLSMPAGVIAGLSGIHARRFWDEGVTPSDVAAQAGELALRQAGVAAARVGVVINTSVCRDYLEPSVACVVHRRLGLPAECVNYDLSNACLGFVTGMDVVAAMIERGDVEYGLVVDGEGSRHAVGATVDRLNATGDARAFADNFATLTLGSGAAAMVLGRSDLVGADAHVYSGSVALAATEHSHLCRGSVDGMLTDGPRLLVAGVALAERTFRKACAAFGWTSQSLSEVVTHQVSALHSTRLAAALGLDLTRMLGLYPEHGNVGPASLPMVLARAAELRRIHPGDTVALMGIGSGLNCAMAEIIW